MVHRHGGVCMNREPTLLVLITGAAGTGKSTVADLLSHRWSTSHLDFDTVTRPIVDRALREHPEWDEPTCLREVKDQRYAAFFESIERQSPAAARCAGRPMSLGGRCAGSRFPF